jgi:hypothetical protein
MSQEWKLNGTYFEACNCDAACPCVFLSDPTEDDCTVLVAWHIDKGNFDGVSLDDLNVALAVVIPGNMVEVKWTAAVLTAKPRTRPGTWPNKLHAIAHEMGVIVDQPFPRTGNWQAGNGTFSFRINQRMGICDGTRRLDHYRREHQRFGPVDQ